MLRNKGEEPTALGSEKNARAAARAVNNVIEQLLAEMAEMREQYSALKERFDAQQEELRRSREEYWRKTEEWRLFRQALQGPAKLAMDAQVCKPAMDAQEYEPAMDAQVYEPAMDAQVYKPAMDENTQLPSAKATPTRPDPAVAKRLTPDTTKRSSDSGHGQDCPCCSKYYRAVRVLAKETETSSKHARRKSREPQDTPPGFWDVAFTPEF